MPRRIAIVALAVAAAISAAAAEPEKPTLVVYDFTPLFDAQGAGGDLGRRIADCITGHAARSECYTTFAEVIQEEHLEEDPFSASAKTPPETVAAHAVRVFEADIAVWGSVARREGRRGYVLDVVAARVSGDGASILIRETYEVDNVHGIPPAADRVLAKCLNLTVGELKALAIRRVLVENLLPAGFEKAAEGGARPAGWMKLDDEVARKSVTWADSPEGRGKCIRFDIAKKIAHSYGVIYYSDYIPVEEGAWYRLSVRIRTDKPQVIIWVKGYGEFGDGGGERRVIYKHQKRHYPDKTGTWEEYATEPFRPKHPRFKPKWIRVMLYGYLRPGTVYFDDVKLSRVEIGGADRTDEGMRKAFNEKPEKKKANEQ